MVLSGEGPSVWTGTQLCQSGLCQYFPSAPKDLKIIGNQMNGHTIKVESINKRNQMLGLFIYIEICHGSFRGLWVSAAKSSL